jgi:bacterial/archaeal transporter family-2 protein
MGELGERVGIVAAVVFSAIVALGIALIALVASGAWGDVRGVLQEPAWLWIGGGLSLFIVLAITIAPPRIGTTATIGLVIVGNLVMAAVIDQFGLFGLDRIAVTWPRAFGLLLLAAGAALSLHRT